METILIILTFISLAVYLTYLMGMQKRSEVKALIDDYISKEGSKLIRFKKCGNMDHPFSSLSMKDSISMNIANQITGGVFTVEIYKVFVEKEEVEKEYWLRIIFQGRDIEKHEWLIK